MDNAAARSSTGAHARQTFIILRFDRILHTPARAVSLGKIRDGNKQIIVLQNAVVDCIAVKDATNL